MKIEMYEHDGCFSFEMTAEDLKDAALLARFVLNVTEAVRTAGATAHKDGTFNGHLVLGKRRNANGEIK